MKLKWSCVWIFLVIYFVFLLFLMRRISDISTPEQFLLNVKTHYGEDVRTNIPSVFHKTTKAERKQNEDIPPFLKAELVRRKLSRDEQELWYFLAAQLRLHTGHLITPIPNVDDMVTSLLEYQRTLNEDILSYMSKIQTEPFAHKKERLSILSNFNSNMTQLFNGILPELKRNLHPYFFSKGKKLRIRTGHIVLTSLLRRLATFSGDETDWTNLRSHNLGSKVQKHIEELQNPRNCSKTRKLLCGVCSELEDCGFACLVHHISLCLVTAYLSNRTMILNCSGWRYSKRGWDAAFLPVTNCTSEPETKGKKDFKITQQLHWVFDKTIQTVAMHLPIRVVNPVPEIFPPAVPEDILDRVLAFNSHPPSWWVGQFKVWAMRLTEDVDREVKLHLETQNVTGVVVGLQVRRTDKTKEANYYPLEAYMVYVEEWYDAYEYLHPGTERKVYLATDDSYLIFEAEKKYPRYQFLHDKNISFSAKLKYRYNEWGLRGVLKDIYSLLKCQYVVCSFSSTICRLVYELIQTTQGEAHSFQSLDDTYYVAGQETSLGRAIMDHKPLRPEELAFRRGDLLRLYGNHWDGYLLGSHLGENKTTGLVPAFKFDIIFKSHNYSSYT